MCEEGYEQPMIKAGQQGEIVGSGDGENKEHGADAKKTLLAAAALSLFHRIRVMMHVVV